MNSQMAQPCMEAVEEKRDSLTSTVQRIVQGAEGA